MEEPNAHSECDNCSAPNRLLWTFGRLPLLESVAVGDWNELKRCSTCSVLWVSVPHEPYASFEFVTLWPFNQSQWQRLNADGSARAILQWHDAVISEQWETLPESEIEFVNRWRDRTYRNYNPIDAGPGYKKPTIITHSADLMRLISSDAN